MTTEMSQKMSPIYEQHIDRFLDSQISRINSYYLQPRLEKSVNLRIVRINLHEKEGSVSTETAVQQRAQCYSTAAKTSAKWIAKDQAFARRLTVKYYLLSNKELVNRKQDGLYAEQEQELGILIQKDPDRNDEGRWDEAISHYKNAIDSSSPTTDAERIKFCSSEMGYCHLCYKDPKKRLPALECYQTSMAVLNQMPSTPKRTADIAFTNHQLGFTYGRLFQDKNNLLKALPHFDKAIAYRTNNGRTDDLMNSRRRRLEVVMRIEQINTSIDPALAALDESLALIKYYTAENDRESALGIAAPIIWKYGPMIAAQPSNDRQRVNLVKYNSVYNDAIPLLESVQDGPARMVITFHEQHYRANAPSRSAPENTKALANIISLAQKTGYPEPHMGRLLDLQKTPSNQEPILP